MHPSSSQDFEDYLQKSRSLTRHDNQLFYLICLKELGKMMKRCYKVQPSQELKKEILSLFHYIEDYEIN